MKTDVESVISSLERVPVIIASLVSDVARERLRQRPSPKKWSIHEHAVHITHVQPMMEKRLERMLTEDHPRIRSYFPDQQEDDGMLLSLDLTETMLEFPKERERLGRRLRALHDSDWQRTAEHEEYEQYSVFIMFRHLALHDLFHAYRIEELLLTR